MMHVMRQHGFQVRDGLLQQVCLVEQWLQYQVLLTTDVWVKTSQAKVLS